jgi:integrase
MAYLVKDARGRSNYWYCCYTTPDGRRLKKSTKKSDRLKAWEVCLAMVNAEGAIAAKSATEQQLRKVINDALVRVGERKLDEPTIKEHLDAWIENKKGAVSEATLLAYRQARDLLVKFLGGRSRAPIRALTKKDALAFRDYLLSEGRKASTVNKILKKYLTGPLETARKEGLVDYNAFVAVDSLQHEPIVKQTFRPDQIVQLVAAADNDWQGAVLFAYGSGARLQDVANLKWNNLDLENGVAVFVERKGKRLKKKPIVVGLHTDFTDWLATQRTPIDGNAPVFPTLANRTGAGRNGLSRAFEYLMDRVGIKSPVLKTRTGKKGRSVRALNFHSFRHGAASAVFNSEAIKELQRRITGHSGRSGVLERYTHADLEVVKRAVASIPRLPKSED